ncbi:multidrug efflux MFS transporter [Allobacillus sp. SKP2-8]|uniref:DHA2 family efflux MFS transporter permease subunit n=1 Tax=unclassified Allobacillus TaxID=2628859 RepID=UPI001182C533|nr:DHA2 family efflux MFS transporter permease subunit [Allobacillus sp. SKP2-8]TSJ61778.1 multidrug efflux MFS transporter [Allobacillus sp. SKP2-8]
MTKRIEHKAVVVVIMATAFLFTFNQFLLITGYPTIMDEFGVNATQVQWLTTAFLLTTIVFIPITGYLSNTFSAKSLVVFSLSCLVVGLIIGGYSLNFGMLVASRVVQAIGAGIILPLVQTILLKVFPYERRGFAMGLLGAVVNVAPASAPSLSGIVIDYFGWRSLHWILLPLVGIVLVFAMFKMKNVLDNQEEKLDFLSIAFSAIGFSVFIFGMSRISVTGFGDPLVIFPMIIGLLTIMLFIRRQLHLRLPVLNIRLIKNSTFRLALILIFINMMLLLSAETILPMFAQDVLGASAFLSGFVLVPGTILLSVITIVSGNLFDRYGGKIISIIGFSFTFVSLVLLNTIGIDQSPFWIMIYFCFFMMGFGLTLMPLVTLGMNALNDADIPHGSAIVNTVRQFAMTFGIVALTTIISVTTATMDAPYRVGTYWGTTYAFLVMALLALTGIILSIFIKNKE